MKDYLRQVGALVWKDLTLELRTWDRMSAMGAFAVLVAVLFHYAVDRTVIHPRELAAGLIWLTIVFGGLLGLGRTFALEEEDGAFDGILTSPMPKDAIFLAKVSSNFLLLLLLVLLVLFVFVLFFQVAVRGNPFALFGVLSLGVLGFTALGTLYSGVTVRTRMGETLLPVLVFPLLIPMVVFGVRGTSLLFAGVSVSGVEGSLRVLGGFSLVALLSGAFLFRFVVED